MNIAKRFGFWCAVLTLCLLAGLFTGCSRDPNVRKQKYLESGQRYYDKGKYREAEIQFQNAVQVDTRFVDARYKLALTDMKLGQWNDAYQQLEKIIEIQPDHYAAHLDLANVLIGVRPPQLKEAKEHLDLLQQKQPNNPDVFVALANYNAANNNLVGALASVQTALKLAPNRSDIYLNAALLQARTQQWDAAEGSYRKAVELAPTSVNAQISLGNFFQLRGRYPEAEQQFRKAIAVAPSDPDPRGSLARLYMAENKYSQAEEFLKQAKNDFPDNSVGYRMLGDFYFANNKIDEAAAEYAAIYQKHPKDITVKKNYIQLLILQKRIDDARKLNDELLKTAKDDTDALIYKGQIEIASGKASAAVSTLQGVLKTEPDNSVANYQLGLAFEQLGNGTQAEAAWRNAIRLRPDLTEAHRGLAGAAIRRGDAAALAVEADQIIALQPDSPDGYLLRAIADINRRQFPTAEEYINRALQKAPNNPAAYQQLGYLREAQGRPADAQKAFQQALDRDPNSIESLEGMIRGYVTQKQLDKALAFMNAQLAKSPQNGELHILMGRLLLEQKNDGAGAEVEFRRAAELSKNSPDSLLGLGMSQSEQGKTDVALQTFLDAAKTYPKEVDFWFRAGTIYRDRQDWEKAKQMYQKVLDIQPENPAASNDIAYVMLQQGGNVDVALALAQRARQKLPDNPDCADTLGWAYYHKGVYNSAIDLFREAVKKSPDNLTYNFHLGLAYARNGQAAQARQQLQKIKPDSSEANELRQALAQSKG